MRLRSAIFLFSMVLSVAVPVMALAGGPAPKAGGIFDDSTRAAPGGQNPRGGVWDDSTKPGPKLGVRGNDRGGIYDDSTKPVDPAANPRGGVIDDSTKPEPKPPR